MSIDAFDDRARWFGGRGRAVVGVGEVGAAGGLAHLPECLYAPRAGLRRLFEAA
jgi:hypothetical protein